MQRMFLLVFIPIVRSGVSTVFFDNKSEGKPPSLESGVRTVVENFRQPRKDKPPYIK